MKKETIILLTFLHICLFILGCYEIINNNIYFGIFNVSINSAGITINIITLLRK